MSQDASHANHISVIIPRSGGRKPVVLSVGRAWVWVGTILILALLAAAAVAVMTYARTMRRLHDYSTLAVEVETLRRQNQAVKELESELKDLRELQQQMLHLAGIRPALGTEGEEAADLPMDEGGEAAPILIFWPVEGEILRGYDRDHRGVDIAAPRKRSVVAAGAGKVTQAARDRQLGLRIAIAHDDSLMTVYASNEVNLVAPGDSVEAGQVIALVGSSPENTTPHLHFEVWKGSTPMRPRDAIPDLFPDDAPGSQ